jgi:pilus assembly protein FimV
VDNSLHETVEAVDEVEFEIDPALEAMLQGSDESSDADSDDGLEFNLGFADDEPADAETDSAEADLDALLSGFNPEEAEDSDNPAVAMTSAAVEAELTDNISHDLEMDPDAEVDELLGSTDDDIELVEQRNDDEQDEILDRMNLLSDADEIETKLDLARAYIEMEDTEGARDILTEITSEGSDTQREEARKLLESLA